jgi:hypothetical protein
MIFRAACAGASRSGDKIQPVVNAAAARLDAAAATQSALEAGSHEFELSSGLQRRNVTNEARRYNEWEIQLSRAVRLPNKARIDRHRQPHPQWPICALKMPSTKWQGDCWKSGPDGCAVSS